MKPAPFLPLLTTVLALVGGTAHAQSTAPAGVTVVVAKATNACFSDLVRVTGFIVPRQVAIAGVDSEGARVAEVLVREGDVVKLDQELARLIPPGSGQPAIALKSSARDGQVSAHACWRSRSASARAASGGRWEPDSWALAIERDAVTRPPARPGANAGASAATSPP